MSFPDTAIIIPQFNAAHLTVNCVRSLHAHHPSPPRVIVVDDGSRRSELELLRAANLSDTDVLPGPHRGVTRAWLRGAEFALRDRSTRSLIFLNNDVVTTGPWIATVSDMLRHGQALLVGPRWRSEPLPFLREQTSEVKQTLEVWPRAANQLLEGWCLGISVETWQTLGGFDANFVSYFSDTDLQARIIATFATHARPLAHLDLPLTHTAHSTAKTLPNRRQIWTHDRDRFLKKWSPG